MIDRYSLPKMKKIWELENRFNKMLDVEIAVCEAWNRLGKVPDEALRIIKQKAKINVPDILEIEKKTKHDVIAFLTSLEKYIGENSKYVHLGLTSSDVVDTGFILLIMHASGMILSRLDKLMCALKKLSKKHKLTYMMGRTHGVHAEITTFGFKTALWYQETLRNVERFKYAVEHIRYGKISGAVGTYTNLDMRVEVIALKLLKLKPEPISSQIVQRDRFAFFIQTLALIAAFIEKIAVEIRLLQKTETLEVEEPFSIGQKGSSAMPHKHNPILCEQLSGLARIVRANSIPALENISLWHERDISHSSVERVIFPDSTMLVDYMLEKLLFILENLKVNKKKMLFNINITRGMIFSQNLLIKLIEKGLIRNKAYELIQQEANRAHASDLDFKGLVSNNEEIKKYLTEKELDACFDYKFNEKKILKTIDRGLNYKAGGRDG